MSLIHNKGLEFPRVRLELVEDLSPADPGGFLRLRRRRYVAHYPDGTESQPFIYDEVDRKALDAVVIAAHFVGPLERRHIYLRSALRPPIAMRDRGPLLEEDHGGALWELPAGLVEPDEWSPHGVVCSAQRELNEELGFEVQLSRLVPLGPHTFPAPGMVAERHIYFEVEVDPNERREPELDGSALERCGAIEPVSLEDALKMCASGEIEDSKTELALRRLHERLG